MSSSETTLLNEAIMKRFLYAMQVKGAKVCDGIEISSDGDIFTSDGTAFTSFAKDVEFVFGALDENGDLVAGDLANPVAEDKHYLKITRGRGDVRYKLVRGLNDLLGKDDPDAIGDPLGLDNTSLADLLRDISEEVQRVKLAVDDAIAANKIVTNNDVDRLEAAFDYYIQTLESDLEFVMAEFIRMANLRDQRILTDYTQDLDNTTAAIQGTFDKDVGHAKVTFGQVASVEKIVYMRPIYKIGQAEDSDRKDISNWAVSVRLEDSSSKILSDSIMYEAQIIDSGIYWNDADQTELTTEVTNHGQLDGAALKVTVKAEACENMTANDELTINCFYAGDLTQYDLPAAHDYDTLSDDAASYNQPVQSGSSMGEIGKAEHDLPDSDVTNEKIDPMSRKSS